MKDEEKSPQERFAFVSKSFGSDKEHAQRLYDYSSRHWLSYSTPILAFGRAKRGLPISCFLPYLHDSAEGLVDCLSEVNWLSMLGGGIGIGIGIRSSDDKSVGVMPHLRTYDASSLAYRQGKTRRGSYAAYLNISHPDILIFLEMRKPTGDQNMRCPNLHHGINITDDFMQIIEKCMLDPKADDTWELKDPNNGEVRDKVSAKELWQRILEMRMHTGEPYLHFIDTSNTNMPEFQKKLGLSIKQSNLCLTGDTIVNVIVDEVNKTIRLDEVISLFNEGKNIRVESKNLNSGNVEYSQITNAAMTARNAQLILIEDEVTGKSIRCTPEHKVYTKNRGYVMAKDLKENDILDLL
jgi:ribonucleoside-diphosphate reductase alpha chain